MTYLSELTQIYLEKLDDDLYQDLQNLFTGSYEHKLFFESLTRIPAGIDSNNGYKKLSSGKRQNVRAMMNFIAQRDGKPDYDATMDIQFALRRSSEAFQASGKMFHNNNGSSTSLNYDLDDLEWEDIYSLWSALEKYDDTTCRS